MLLIALAENDFDVTEVVQPWKVFRDAGVEVRFATDSGRAGACDPLLLTGVIFGQLGAKPENIALYQQLLEDTSFKTPLRFADVDPKDYTVFVLPGGHAKGMRPYLESTDLTQLVLRFLAAKTLIGSICHGAIVLARTIDPETGDSVLKGRQLTCLPYFMEALAYGLTFWKLGRYYRTYDAYVEQEVRDAVGPEGAFIRGPLSTRYDVQHIVEDGDLITARWPGDANAWAKRLLARTQQD